MPWHLASFVIPAAIGFVALYIYRDKLPRGMKDD